MNPYNISEEQLLSSIRDINSNEIPKYILDNFFILKEQIGSLPMGISFIPNLGYFFIDTSAKIYKYFPTIENNT